MYTVLLHFGYQPTINCLIQQLMGFAHVYINNRWPAGQQKLNRGEGIADTNNMLFYFLYWF